MKKMLQNAKKNMKNRGGEDSKNLFFSKVKSKLRIEKMTVLCSCFMFLVLAGNVYSANGIPFYDKLETFLTWVKVIGGMFTLCAFLYSIYSYRQGRDNALSQGVWFVGCGVVTFYIKDIATEFGFLSGTLF
ncbi:MAG: hypothetical protein ACRC3I_10720 [Cetobacterium sp.]